MPYPKYRSPQSSTYYPSRGYKVRTSATDRRPLVNGGECKECFGLVRHESWCDKTK